MSYRYYRGAIATESNRRWDIQLARPTGTGYDSVALDELRFAPGNEIEWAETEKHDVLQGSALTLHLLSPSDRYFTGFYSEGQQAVDCRITGPSGGAVYWCGTLDPEQYSEPYAYQDGYEVELTFTDFGRLGFTDYVRMNAATGRVTLAQLFDRAFIDICHLSQWSLGTGLRVCAGGTWKAFAPADIEVWEDNFFDEEGEPMKWDKVIEAVLLPLGLRAVQYCGTVYVYDLEWLRSQSPRAIAWGADDQTLGTDKVYRKFTVNFSPYGDNRLTDGSLSPDDVGTAEAEHTWWLHPGLSAHPVTDTAFKVRLASDADNAAIVLGTGGTATGLHTLPRFFAVLNGYSGDGSAGVAELIRAPQPGATEHSTVQGLSAGVYNCCHRNSAGAYDRLPASPVLSAAPRQLVPGGKAQQLCIKLGLLLDARYNPFESGQNDGNFEAQQKYWNRVYIPARVYIRGTDGSTWHYANDELKESDRMVSQLAPGVSTGLSGWQSGEGDWGEMWLCYYSWDDPGHKSACQGWAVNRPCAGKANRDEAPLWWQKRGDGEYIDMPPVSGELHVEIGHGVYPAGPLDAISASNGQKVVTVWWNGPNNHIENPEYIDCARWMLLRDLSVEAVDEFGRSVDADDIVYEARLDADAANDLSIDTRCGSARNVPAGSRGLYYTGGQPLVQVRRSSAGDCIERELIAMLASQYDCRHTRLQGTVSMTAGTPGIGPYTDASQSSGTLFLMTGLVQSLEGDTGEATYVELSAPKYEPV